MRQKLIEDCLKTLFSKKNDLNKMLEKMYRDHKVLETYLDREVAKREWTDSWVNRINQEKLKSVQTQRNK